MASITQFSSWQTCWIPSCESSFNSSIWLISSGVAVAQRIASQWQLTEEKGKKNIRRREDSLAVVEQMLKGKTPEEIGQMDEFRGFSFASIQALCQEKAWMKDALRLVLFLDTFF